MTAISPSQLERVREKRSEEISAHYLESLEAGYYEQDAQEVGQVICSKGKIPAAQVKEIGRSPAIAAAGLYGVITIPFDTPSGQYQKKSGAYVGPTSEPVLRIAFPSGASTKTVPAAFPAALWLYEALDFERQGRRDRALDIIFGEMDKLFRRGDFEVSNRLLSLLDVESLSLNILIAFLTITLPAHEWLPERAVLYSRVEKRLSGHANKAKLLSGLKAPLSNGPRFY